MTRLQQSASGLGIILLLGTVPLLERTKAQPSSFVINEILPKRIVSKIPQLSYSLTGRQSMVVQPLVYVNGILQADVDDYIVEDNSINFPPDRPVTEGSIVQIIYW